MSHRGFFFCALLVSLAMSTFAQPSPTPAPATPEVAMDAIRTHILKEEPSDIPAVTWPNKVALREQLAGFGADAVPAILARIESENNKLTETEYGAAITMIPGEKVDRILADSFQKNAALRRMALTALTVRRSLYGPLTFPLSDEALGLLVDMVKNDGPGMVMLGMCVMNDTKARFGPILEQFKTAVRYDGDYVNTLVIHHLSPRAQNLYGYLRSFMDMGEIAWVPLRAAIQEAREQNDAEMDKWLCMAAGFAGDPEVADRLEPVVLSDPDRYVRTLAIRAYAASAGQKALPLLETLLDDTTVGEYDVKPFVPPPTIIADTAREEIYRINNPKPGKINGNSPVQPR